MLGVLGGMGPAATADWMAKLVRATPAKRDQDHIPVLLYSAPQIPDRTEAILSSGRDPTPALLEGLKVLEGGGARAIAMPCNTAHHWHEVLQASTGVPILHIVDAVAETLASRGVGGPVGVLATTATVRSGLYDARLRRTGRSCLYPSAQDQSAVMQVIRLVKSGDTDSAREALQAATTNLAARGAQTIILACTELPLVLPERANPKFIDAGASLAQFCVRWWETRPDREGAADGPDLDRGFSDPLRDSQLLQGGGSAQRDPAGV